ncbi:LysR family transcriptional regulator [Streptomyces viridochromogenes]|uniref:LysR family transcriptional regulator n=1 Tax=Streptomyces viridochromogenes TaxID=1938 RepID=A0A0J7YXN7_STRVR|nr:LysR family transcriptional regulator [Streptomyces viridochromogenes]KMS68212.1 LysR family transcriptional regulator [Streptomyces viridochromogenes]
MDLVAACRAFVSVSEHGSFTVGAAAARTAQSVVSRRIAALEQRLGERLLDRSSRTVTLTPFGRDLLPTARQLVRLADRLEHEAEAARRRPLRLAVPADCPTAALARLIAEAGGQGVLLDPFPAGPAERADLVTSRQVRAALLAVAPAEATWTVPLGLAVAREPGGGGPIYLDTLRPGRADRDRRPRRVWLQPEDDVPHVRDRLARLRDAVGLRPAQLAVAPTVAAAAADVLSRGDALLCSAAQARELRLHWRPVGELGPAFARGFSLAVADETDADAVRVRRTCGHGIARCLDATESPETPP